MKVLILHHVESMWNESLKNYGTHIDQVVYDIYEHLQENNYDKVILNRFDDWKLEECHNPISDYIDDINIYAYGWEEDMFENESQYCEGGSHSMVVEIADWMHKLKGCDVDICGAFDGECIEDLEIALEHLGISYNRIENLII